MKTTIKLVAVACALMFSVGCMATLNKDGISLDKAIDDRVGYMLDLGPIHSESSVTATGLQAVLGVSDTIIAFAKGLFNQSADDVAAVVE